jgi:ribosomal protein L37AE/L43A
MVFWVVTLCRLVGSYGRFGGIYCLNVRFQVLAVESMKVTIFWDVCAV